MISSKPRVFVSSTIPDFLDLRSALRFYLEDFGFEVQMSEVNDFERRPEEGTFTSCFNAIRYCDYFVLLVGSRKGSEYMDSISVTQQEFRTAAELAIQGKIRPVLFIRQSVKTALSTLETTGSEPKELLPFPEKNSALDDLKFVQSFVKEIENTDCPPSLLGGTDGKLWLYRFSNFRDIVDALRVNLNLYRSIPAQVLLANLEWELRENLATLSTKFDDGQIRADHSILGSLRESQPISLEDRPQVRLTYEHALDAYVFNLSIYWSFSYLRTEALQQAIFSGEFLRYVPQTKRLVVTEIQEAMDTLLFEIRRCHNLCKKKEHRVDEGKLFQLGLDSHDPTKDKPEHVDVAHSHLANIYSIYDAVFEIYTLSVLLLYYISNPDETVHYKRSDRKPPSPFADRIAMIQARSPTPDDMRPVLDQILNRSNARGQAKQ